MNVQVKSSNGITVMPAETRLLAERKVFLEGDITSELACNVTRQIMLLTAERPELPIDLLICSNGGEINAGMLIYDVVQSSIAPIRMFCIGHAYSMGALLFASGQHGRFMFPHSELMLHEPLLGNRIAGNASSVRSISDSLMETRAKMNRILALHTGKTEEEIEKATGFDHYFSPEESIEFGLADEIVGFRTLMEG